MSRRRRARPPAAARPWVGTVGLASPVGGGISWRRVVAGTAALVSVFVAATIVLLGRPAGTAQLPKGAGDLIARRSLPAGDDRVREPADPLGLDRHLVTGLQELRRIAEVTDPVGRPGRDDVPGL